MTSHPPSLPGRDEILVMPPPRHCLCNSREHRRLGHITVVVITFGQLGTPWARDALWMSSWHKTYPLCQACWDMVRQTAQERRPGLIITDTAKPHPPQPTTVPHGQAARRH